MEIGELFEIIGDGKDDITDEKINIKDLFFPRIHSNDVRNFEKYKRTKQ